MQENDKKFIQAAIDAARKARRRGNHPFGAILVGPDGRILLEAENTVVTARDCTGHAETNLMRAATSKYERDFLGRCTLYTSTEPCPMCAGAIVHARVEKVVFGAPDPRSGAAGSVFDLLPSDHRFNHRVQVEGGVMAAECGGLLREFFRSRR